MLSAVAIPLGSYRNHEAYYPSHEDKIYNKCFETFLPVLPLLSSVATIDRSYRNNELCMLAARNTSYDPLCATDGQTYQNLLAFQCYISFFNVRGLSFLHGSCVSRPEPDYCVFSFTVWRRVCGADNVTYSSVWELMCEAQRQRKPNSVQYEGACQIACTLSLHYKPVCSWARVEYPNTEALTCAALRNPDGNITLWKEGVCTENARPVCGRRVRRTVGQTTVCGSNFVTYSSLNELMCIRSYNPDLDVLHDGICKLSDFHFPDDDTVTCYFADNHAIWMPICGSDNVTYPNPYVYKCAILRGTISEDITIQMKGSCEQDRSDEDIMDEEDASCNQVGTTASLIDSPLFCASDGKAYYSTKHYTCAVVRNGDWFPYFIARLNVPCDSSDTPCERLRFADAALVPEPLCASDDRTYANPLSLMCAMAGEPKLTKRHKGACIVTYEEPETVQPPEVSEEATEELSPSPTEPPEEETNEKYKTSFWG